MELLAREKSRTASAEKTEGGVAGQEDRETPTMVAVKIARPLDTSIAAQLARLAMRDLARRRYFKDVKEYQEVAAGWNRECIEAGQLPVLDGDDITAIDAISPPEPFVEFEQFSDF